MSRIFLTSVDLNKNELLSAKLQTLATASAPTSPVQGQVYYDSDKKTIGFYETTGTAWRYAAVSGQIVNADIASGAAIAYGKLNLSASIVNADVASAAAIAYSKLSLSNSIVNADISTSAAIVYSKLSLGNSIVNADVSTSAAIVYSKLSLGNSIVAGDIAASLKPSGTASTGTEALRAIGTTASTAMAGNTTLNAIATPTANVAMGGFNITGLADPVNATDAANKQYVDAARTGLDTKASVRLASITALTGVTYTAAGGTSTRGQITSAPNTLDGTNLAQGDRVLIKDTAGLAGAATAAANGIWVVTTLGTGATGVWDRATDFDTDAEVTSGAYVWVEEGTQADTAWVLTTSNPIVIGGASGTSLTWVMFSSAGSLIAGAGLTKTGNAIDAVGTTNRIFVDTNSIDISVSYVGQTSITTLGNVTSGTWSANAVAVLYGGTGSTTAAGARTNLGATTKYSVNNTSGNSSFSSPTVTWTVTHSLNTLDVIVQMHQVSDGQVVEPTITKTSVNVVTLTWNAGSLPADNTYRCVVIG